MMVIQDQRHKTRRCKIEVKCLNISNLTMEFQREIARYKTS